MRLVLYDIQCKGPVTHLPTNCNNMIIYGISLGLCSFPHGRGFARSTPNLSKEKNKQTNTGKLEFSYSNKHPRIYLGNNKYNYSELTTRRVKSVLAHI